MIILKDDDDDFYEYDSENLNSNMIILKEHFFSYIFIVYKKFKFQYDNT